MKYIIIAAITLVIIAIPVFRAKAGDQCWHCSKYDQYGNCIDGRWIPCN